MKKLRLLGLFFGLVLVGPNVMWSQDCSTGGFCCDPEGAEFDGPSCFGAGETIWPGDDGVVSDAGCSNVNDPACSIPLDGGLSLLALAGGGLATAAMRRRREEEEAAALGAA